MLLDECAIQYSVFDLLSFELYDFKGMFRAYKVLRAKIEELEINRKDR